MIEDLSELVPLNQARQTLIPKCSGRPVDCSTLWRWINKGLAGPDGQRIKLDVTYVGRTPHVSAQRVRQFFEAITAAKREACARRELLSQQVSVEELRRAGLMAKASSN